MGNKSWRSPAWPGPDREGSRLHSGKCLSTVAACNRRLETSQELPLTWLPGKSLALAVILMFSNVSQVFRMFPNVFQCFLMFPNVDQLPRKHLLTNKPHLLMVDWAWGPGLSVLKNSQTNAQTQTLWEVFRQPLCLITCCRSYTLKPSIPQLQALPYRVYSSAVQVTSPRVDLLPRLVNLLAGCRTSTVTNFGLD